MKIFRIVSNSFLNIRLLATVFSTALLSLTAAPAPAASYISDGNETSRPYGHVAYCKANPGECHSASPLKTSSIKPEQMAGGKWAKLKQINVSVNKQIKPVSDQKNAGVADLWSASAKSGDCEDYALTKRRKLVNAGFKQDNLRLAMVRTPSGIAHLVLVVRTDKGDLVLDNLKSDIKVWQQTGYRFVKIQSKGGSSEWVSIGR